MSSGVLTHIAYREPELTKFGFFVLILKNCIDYGYKDVSGDEIEFNADTDLRWIKINNFDYRITFNKSGG